MPESSTCPSDGGAVSSQTETTTELEPSLIERLRALVEEDGAASSRAPLPSFAGAGI